MMRNFVPLTCIEKHLKKNFTILKTPFDVETLHTAEL